MRSITYLMRKYPIMSYGILILAVNKIFDAFRFDYDVGGIITILNFLLPVLGLPYYLSHEMMFSLNEGVGFPRQGFYSIVSGLVIFSLLEWIYQLLRAKFRNENSPKMKLEYGVINIIIILSILTLIDGMMGIIDSFRYDHFVSLIRIVGGVPLGIILICMSYIIKKRENEITKLRKVIVNAGLVFGVITTLLAILFFALG